MSEQENGQVSTLQRPATNDSEAWKAYWKAQGQPWRTEREIDSERKKYLAERQAIVPDIERGSYPFKDVKLNRADIEWLLATHENGRGPVDWSDEHQRDRLGLDLRGADLSQVDLRKLPLTRVRGGLDSDEWLEATEKPLNMAAVFMRRTSLRWTCLEGAHLRFAHLEGADLRFARLERAHLRGAWLKEADLRDAHLEKTRLENAVLSDEKRRGPRLADAKWSNVNLAVMKWSQVDMLGDEHEARQKTRDGKVKSRLTQLNEFQVALRANRQLAVALQTQGLNEDASRFAYCAQKLQRIVLRRQKKFGQYLFSLLLDLLAGYGYRPGRSIVWYLATIFGFALTYFAIGHLPFFPDAFVFSLTSFHGRGFFPGLGSENSLHNPLVILAAFEAVIGLLIEISFIATFTQRFFGR